jgi:hypothetical protein
MTNNKYSRCLFHNKLPNRLSIKRQHTSTITYELKYEVKSNDAY